MSCEKKDCLVYLTYNTTPTMFLVKKRLLKIKHAFEGSISNVDLGPVLAKQPIND